MKTTRIVWLLIVTLVLLLAWSQAYPALAALLFQNDSPASRGIDDGAVHGPAALKATSVNGNPNAVETAFVLGQTATARAQATRRAQLTLTAQASTPRRRFPGGPILLTMIHLPIGPILSPTPPTATPTATATHQKGGGSGGGGGNQGAGGGLPGSGGDQGSPIGADTPTSDLTPGASPMTSTVTATGLYTITLAPIAPLTTTLTMTATATVTAAMGRPDTSGFLSAREAFQVAWPRVSAWSPAAALSTAVCSPLPSSRGPAPDAPFFSPWNGPAEGKCGEWRLTFAQSPTATADSQQYAAVVDLGRVNDGETGVQPLAGQPRTVAIGWLDSPDAVEAFMNDGGTGYFGRYPLGRLTGLSLRVGPGRKPVWAVSAASRPDQHGGAMWQVSMDATSGAVDSSTAPALPEVAAYLTAREALAVAQAAAQSWQPDARLSRATAQANPGEEGYDAGQAADWRFEFVSPSVQKAYEVRVIGGTVDSAIESSGASGRPIVGDWPDSPVALEKLRAGPDYPAFAALHPDPAFTLQLQAGPDGSPQWIAGAWVKGASLTLDVTTP